MIDVPLAILPSVSEDSTEQMSKPFVSKRKGSSMSTDSFTKGIVCRRVSTLSDASTIAYAEIRRASHDLSGFEPTLEDFGSANRNYSVALLLKMRQFATDVQVDIDYGDHPSDGKGQAVPLSDEGLVCFRAPVNGQPAKKAISFVEDLDVSPDCIVMARNIDRSVEWPMLQTFCTKTVGVKPLNLRMQRRSNPASALIMFSSNDEAKEFLEKVPKGVSLKGKRPRFHMASP
mmetsp:Transcript_57763/g.118206  ORF Transcript_57763/g.118206 Transcript_57763/m.118206 type:complete len:231 (-) Transcript_57763:121-813(-)